MMLKPLNNNVILELVENVQSGIYMPTTQGQKYLVLACADGVMPSLVGKHVYLNKITEKISLDGKNYYIANANDLLAYED